jgi:hypothetical protein
VIRLAGVLRRVVLLVVLAACEDKQLAQLEVVRADVCACKTPLCAETAMAHLPKDDIHSDRRTQEKAREMMDCLAKIEEAAQDKADPDPDAGSAGSGSATLP